MGSRHPIKYNIVQDDGDESSVTVFLAGGGQLVATREHRNFPAILDALKQPNPTESNIRGLFDVSHALSEKLVSVSERVSVSKGRVYLDHDLLAGPLCDAILRFYEADMASAEQVSSWKPLVAFLEKVMQNPNEHSRAQLFRWLEKHNYAICDDGDFLAYKGVNSDGRSTNSGTAYVNGEKVTGNIPNVPGTVIEMPRSEVQFDPSNGCSTGLHVANYAFARSWSSKLLRCKVNPRDVVSVPTDSGDAKMRVCRYYVLDAPQGGAEDRSLLYAGAYRTLKVQPDPVVEVKPDAPAKPKRPAKKVVGKKAAPKVAPKPEPVAETWPEFYEDFKKADFKRLGFKELVWLAGEWDVKVPAPRTTELYVEHLVKEARARLRAWKKANG